MLRPSFLALLALAATSLATVGVRLHAQDVVISDLHRPSKVIRTPRGNLLVAEVGTSAFAPNSGRVSIVDEKGQRRTLIDGLPSAPTNAANTPSGPSGLYLAGRTLYVVIGEGDPTLPGPVPRTEIPNPSPASPMFSSVLSVKFSAAAEAASTGISLTLGDQEALKAGETIERSDAEGNAIETEMVVDFPDYVPEPTATVPENVRHSHPYGVTADEDYLYVVDGGYNLVHKVDLLTGAYVTLYAFPTTPNPLFGIIGPPRVENVPTSIRWNGGQLVVSVLSGFPFVSGLSQVVEIDPDSGEVAPLISGLTSAVDVIPLFDDEETVGYLTLEYSTAHLAGGPGRLQVFDATGAPVAILSSTLASPAGMVYDRKAGRIVVVEINSNRLVAIPLP